MASSLFHALIPPSSLRKRTIPNTCPSSSSAKHHAHQVFVQMPVVLRLSLPFHELGKPTAFKSISHKHNLHLRLPSLPSCFLRKDLWHLRCVTQDGFSLPDWGPENSKRCVFFSQCLYICYFLSALLICYLKQTVSWMIFQVFFLMCSKRLFRILP